MAPERELWHVRLTDDHRPGCAQAPHCLAVLGRRLLHQAGPVRGQLAREVDVVLDRDGDAEQRTVVAGVEARLRGPRLLQGALRADCAEGIQSAVEAIDAVEVE